MISVVIPVDERDPIGLLRTLADLVSGAVESVVGELVLAAAEPPQKNGALAEIIEESGARLVVIPGDAGERRKAAATTARHGWVMFLMPGDRLEAGWTRNVAGYLASGQAAAGRSAVLHPDGRGFLLDAATRWFGALKSRDVRSAGNVLAPRRNFETRMSQSGRVPRPDRLRGVLAPRRGRSTASALHVL